MRKVEGPRERSGGLWRVEARRGVPMVLIAEDAEGVAVATDAGQGVLHSKT